LVVGKWRNTGEPVTELRKGSVRLQEAIAGDANTQGSQYWCVWFETKDGITRNEM
jgi:hypothetical protein